MLDLNAPMQRVIYWQGNFEPDLTRSLQKVMRPGEVFIDIGANLGWHSLFLLVRRPDILCSYAFEPSKQMFASLEKGIHANNCQNRCYAKRLAIGDRKGVATLKTFTNLDPMHASLFPLADWPYEEEEIELDTLDSQAVNFLAPPAVIKCDVEGGERNVLLGAQAIMNGKFGPPPIWFLEANYEAAGMAGFFPWDLIEIAGKCAPYEGYYIRERSILPLPNRTALRHGDTLVLAIPELHRERLEQAAI